MKAKATIMKEHNKAEVHFINPSTLEMTEAFRGGDTVGTLKGIKLKKGDLYLAN